MKPADDGVDWELFGLEVEHQIQSKIKPELKKAMDARQAAFDKQLAKHPHTIAEQARFEEERAASHRLKERRDYVASGKAKARTSAQVSTLAQALAKHWKAQFINTTRNHSES